MCKSDAKTEDRTGSGIWVSLHVLTPMEWYKAHDTPLTKLTDRPGPHGWGGMREVLFLTSFQWTRRKLPQKQKWWVLWGWILTSSVCCWELRVGTLVRWGFCIYKQKCQEPWRSWSVSKCPFRQAEWEALANRFGCHMHKEVNPSGRDTAPSYCVCIDVTVSSQDQRPVRLSEAEPKQYNGSSR